MWFGSVLYLQAFLSVAMFCTSENLCIVLSRPECFASMSTKSDF